ncbi:MAG: Fe-S cluster assembly protein SufD [Gammaproteobacteria bacterium]|nr:Fe-S cluster assembly protein SufD [Gammaproteobacteria bacterium]
MSSQAAAVALHPDDTAVGHYLNEFETVANRLPGNAAPWLRELRRHALDHFAGAGFPSPRDEQWKYTRLSAIEKRAFRPTAETTANLDPERIEKFLFPNLECRRLVFVDGRYQPHLSTPVKTGEELTAGSLASALEEQPDTLKPHLARVASPETNGFSALNAAFMTDGAIIQLPAKMVVEEPIHLLFIATDNHQEPLFHPRNLIVARDGSQAKIIESYVSIGEASHLTNATTEVVLGENSVLEHYKLQQENQKAFHIAALQVHQERDSRFVSHSISFGGLLARNDINVWLNAEGAECTLNGLYMVDGRQHVDFHTTIEHTKPHGTSHEFYKGILNGRSRGVFNGRVHVHPDAQKTDSTQSNKNILLSRNAEVNAKPELEIYADDVKCSHGATVGQLDEEMLFYLRSRGIGADAARGLLTYGFAQDIVNRMSIPQVRDYLEESLVTRVPDAEHVKEMV